MTVYFMRRLDGAIKIGHCRQDLLRTRAKQIMYKLNEDYIDIIRTVPGTHVTATWFHKHFADLRIEGEWYHYHPGMRSLNAPEEPLMIFRPWADWMHFRTD